MGLQKLQIKQLSDMGELLRVINCRAGQVTVLRAHASSDLTPFQRALAGVPGPERFSLQLDGQPYSPDEHCLIGFGERFPQIDICVLDFLTQHGIPEANARSLILSYGLDSHAERRCAELSTDEERRLRLLVGTHVEGKVLVLNNPFEEISSQWRERYAELVINYARKFGGIVVIPSLSYRPQHWIDNESINRVQVGENIQKTIGFGSDSTDVNEMVKQLRESFQEEKKAQEVFQEPAPPSSVPVEATHKINKPAPERQTPQEAPKKVSPEAFQQNISQMMATPPRDPFRNVFVVVFVVFCFVVGSAWVFKLVRQPVAASPTVVATGIPNVLENMRQLQQANPTPNKETAKPPSMPAVKTVPETVVSKIPVTQDDTQKIVGKTDVGIQPPVANIKTPPGRRYALDMYPSDIRRSVIAAFEQTESRPDTESRKVSSKRDSSPAGESDFFRLLQSTSGSGKSLPDRKANRSSSKLRKSSGTSASRSSAEIEKRREMIRQKFLEAIERQERGY